MWTRCLSMGKWFHGSHSHRTAVAAWHSLLAFHLADEAGVLGLDVLEGRRGAIGHEDRSGLAHAGRVHHEVEHGRGQRLAMPGSAPPILRAALEQGPEVEPHGVGAAVAVGGRAAARDEIPERIRAAAGIGAVEQAVLVAMHDAQRVFVVDLVEDRTPSESRHAAAPSTCMSWLPPRGRSAVCARRLRNARSASMIGRFCLALMISDGPGGRHVDRVGPEVHQVADQDQLVSFLNLARAQEGRERCDLMLQQPAVGPLRRIGVVDRGLRPQVDIADQDTSRRPHLVLPLARSRAAHAFAMIARQRAMATAA